MKTMEIDGGQNVCNVRSDHVELGQEFDFTTREPRIEMQFASRGDEILLQHLQRKHSRSGATVLTSDQDDLSSLSSHLEASVPVLPL